MMERTQIVSGGGWRRSAVSKIHVKAWSALAFSLSALLSGLGAFEGGLQVACFVAAGTGGVLALLWFAQEKPRSVEWGVEREPSDPHNLHLAPGSHRQSKG